MRIVSRFPTAAVDVAMTQLNLGNTAGFIANSHDTGTFSTVSNGSGFYGVTWTGAGGNANDTLPEQLLALYELTDVNGDVVDLTAGTHNLTWTIENTSGTWDGSNSVIVGMGLVMCTGSTFASPGTAQAGSVALGFLGTNRERNSSWVTGQAPPALTGVQKIEQTWINTAGSSSAQRGYIAFTVYNDSGAILEQGSSGFETSSTASTGLIALGLCLGNDNSLTSGATYTENVRVSYIATPR